jgi:UDP:flavonoid glycosyltransferase YjiC (YdhE family)
VTVVFYISGHGFGHSIRQMEIINTLLTLAPQLRVVVRTNAAEWLFARTVRGRVTFDRGETDTGVVQIDSLRLDEHATMARAHEFYRGFDDLVRRESALLRAHGARFVVTDAPPLACAAAHAAGIPSVVCANFTWDWIYERYANDERARQVLAVIRNAYALATAGWRLPLHGGFETIPRVIDLPFVARCSQRDRTAAVIRQQLALPAARPLALVSFGGYGLNELPIDRLDCTADWDIVLTSSQRIDGILPRAVHNVDEDQLYARELRYEDLVKAVDVVITKPGYGIVSDCVANGTAMLYTSRGNFAEYDVMTRAMPEFLRCRFIEREEFEAGQWHLALTALAAAPAPPEQPRTDGASVAAGIILEAVSAP